MSNACHLSLAVYKRNLFFLCLTKPLNSLSLQQVPPICFQCHKFRSIPLASTLLSCCQNHFPHLWYSAPLLGSPGCLIDNLSLPKTDYMTLELHISTVISPFFDSAVVHCSKGFVTSRQGRNLNTFFAVWA